MQAAFATPVERANRFRFADLAHQAMTVYLVLPPDKFNDRFGRWLRLLLQRALSEVMGANARSKVLFLLDEFGTVGALQAVETAFGLARGLGVALWPFVQDLNQLERDYPKSWRTFVANCTGELYFGINDRVTAEEISTAWGDDDRLARHGILKGNASHSMQHLRLVLPNKIMAFTQGEVLAGGGRKDAAMLLRIKGGFEVLAPAHYWRVEDYRDRARPDPYHLVV